VSEPALVLRDLSKSYREGDATRVVLSGFSATFAAGERVALLGKSGSGKSTLLQLIGGIDLPTSGEVVALGKSLGQMGEEQRTLFRRAHLGFVFQAFNLIPTLTIEENLALPLELTGVRRSEARERANALLRELGLGARGASFPDALSGGEQQRVAVGRALVHRPSLLLADEPTGNLDEATGREVIGLIDALSRGGGCTVLVVTHDRDVARWADRVLLLEQGRLVPTRVEPR